ncbi:LOW QUALITY PROTEIN: major facilitator superfamily domain-containing protein 1-like [Pollicipes pollicipes]|uniref:LOW QUALITY PROTEIN: major facilitator superfamily domain-containing protein 1-like n=1 Tax=Pollicipes pollicipes TaxID=41117 RepID=UPI0018854C10|nr:LOW QUALITY PROTEIN: major facilitator superfamily domain-containing protein 1-like [Pollicipes pollicipes]
MSDEGEVQVRPAPRDGEPERDVELTGCGGSLCCDPHRNVHRFVVLPIICFISFGSYFCYDGPGALQDDLKRDMGVNTSQYSNLYAWYSWPNVVLSMVGGFLIDRVFGIRLGAIIFAGFVCVGQVIFASGGILDLFWLMVVGRFVFGIGGESLCVAVNTYSVQWYKGKELNMVLGLSLSVARAGSTVNFNVMKPLYDAVSESYSGYKATGVTLMIAGLATILSLVLAVIMWFLDKRAQVILRRDEGKTGEEVHITDVKDFPVSFWMLTAICVFYYAAIFPFVSFGQVFFIRKFEMTPAEANSCTGIIYIISLVASPFIGLSIDLAGRNILWVMVSVLMTVGCHALMAFSFINPWVAMSILGIAFSMLASALWPMVALVIPERQCGTAYGIMQSVQNLGLALVNMLGGTIVDTVGYLVLEVFFLACLCATMMAAIVILVHDAAHGGSLNMTPGERRRFEACSKRALIAADDREPLLDEEEDGEASPDVADTRGGGRGQGGS